MRCIVCDSNDWENVDQYRLKPQGMSICKPCGFVSYPNKWQSEEDIKKHYRSSYRNPPTSNNLFSGQRKIHFHNVFLQDVFQDWQQKKTKPVIFEIGAAYGLVLHWFKQFLPECQVYGSELTTTYRRNAYHELGIKLSEDFDYSKKYDLIMSYKVAEHQLDIDQYLKKYVDCLNDDGYMYISVPIWFGSLTNFGANGFDLEYYYDPNHINAWAKEHFEYILNKAGLEIVKQDHIIYDSTYLCKKTSNPKKLEVPKLYDFVKTKLDKIKKAYTCFTEGRFEDAINEYNDYPFAHINLYEMTRQQFHQKGFAWTEENFILKSLERCPNSAEILIMAADICMRFGQLQKAISYIEDALRAKPENPPSLHMMINVMRELALKAKTEKEKQHYFIQARECSRHLRNVSQQHFREAIDLMYLFNAQIPMPGEISPVIASDESIKRPLELAP